MIEQLLASAKRRGLPWWRKLARLHRGWCVVMVVGAWVAGRALWVASAQTPWREEIAAAYGSAALFYGTPQMDATGTRISYVRQSRLGRAVCVLEVRTGEQRELREEKAATHAIGVEVWPWSPDGQWFAYTVGETLFVWPVDGTLAEAALTPGGKVTDLIWLTPHNFVCLLNRKRVCVVRENRGQWAVAQDYAPASEKWNLSSLNAVGTNRVGWVNSNLIWRLEVTLDSTRATGQGQASSNPATAWFDPQRKDVGEMTCAAATGELLFLCAGAEGARELWRWRPAGGAESPDRLLKAPACTQARWVGQTRFAWVGGKAGENSLRLGSVTNEATQTVPLLAVSRFSAAPDGRRLVITGVASNDISEAIWEYDCGTGSLKCLVPSTTRPSAHAARAVIGKGIFPLRSGARRHFYVVRPANFDPRSKRKYPVVLGNTAFVAGDPLYQGRANGPLWVQALANCGCIVVVVNRGSWYENIGQWGEAVAALHTQLQGVPELDWGQAFLFGASAETQYLSKLATERPEWWKGIILMNPGGLPDLTAFPLTKPVPKLLVSYGELEGQQERLKRYQEEAAQRGICVEVVMHKEANHWLQAQEAVRERTQAIVRFVSDDAAE